MRNIRHTNRTNYYNDISKNSRQQSATNFIRPLNETINATFIKTSGWLGYSLKLLSVVIWLIFLAFNCQAKPINVGIVHYPPLFVLGKNKQPSGILPDIIRDTLTRAEIDFQFNAYPIKRLYASLVSGEVNLAVGLKGVPVYHQHVLYSRQPITTIEVAVYALSNQKLPSSFAELVGKRVGLIRGYTYSGNRKLFMTEDNLKNITTINTTRNGLVMVEKGRIDYMLAYKNSSEAALAERPIRGLKNKILSDAHIYFILNKKTQNAAQIMNLINSAFQQINGPARQPDH